MTATVEDTCRPDEFLRLSRTVEVVGDAVAAAFEAIMMLETHEAMERFLVNSKELAYPHQPLTDDYFVSPRASG